MRSLGVAGVVVQGILLPDRVKRKRLCHLDGGRQKRQWNAIQDECERLCHEQTLFDPAIAPRNRGRRR